MDVDVVAPEGKSVHAKIARHLKVDEEKVNKLCKLMEDTVSFEKTVNGTGEGRAENDNSSMTWEEVLSDDDESFASPEQFAYTQRLEMDVKTLLDTLSEREREIIRLRYGCLDSSALTLEQIGKQFAVTRERIRQIESRALRKLREPSRNSIVKDYTEE